MSCTPDHGTFRSDDRLSGSPIDACPLCVCVSAASIQVQILPHYGEISVGASKFFICEGKAGGGHVTRSLFHLVKGRFAFAC